MTDFADEDIELALGKHFRDTPRWRVIWWTVCDAMPWALSPQERWERGLKKLIAESEANAQAKRIRAAD